MMAQSPKGERAMTMFKRWLALEVGDKIYTIRFNKDGIKLETHVVRSVDKDNDRREEDLWIDVAGSGAGVAVSRRDPYPVVYETSRDKRISFVDKYEAATYLEKMVATLLKQW
jgi:hypothetical protein